MMTGTFLHTFLATLGDVTPIVLLVSFYQLVVLREPVPQLRKMILGTSYVVLGLTFFLMGLEKALFPLGNMMAAQLTTPAFLGLDSLEGAPWHAYYWVYIFAGTIGFATAIAEPSLIAVAMKASEVTAGSISKGGLRVAVALGVAVALALGSFRIITGTPLYVYIVAGYAIVVLQTIFAPRRIVALAYDSGGVATSTVTVPIVVALGLGLSGAIPGRNPVLDGFGMIALACMLPIITVMGYAQLREFLQKPK